MKKYMFVALAIFLGACSKLADPRCDITKLRISMSEKELVATCGLPSVRNYATGARTQWVYRGNAVYVYTDDSGVTSWQWSSSP